MATTDPDTSRLLRAVSYNIHACVGRDGRFAPARIVQVLRDLDADIIALQEVEDRSIRGRSVTDYLADELDMHAEAGPTLNRGDNAYGNLLLSRLPVIDARRHDLSVKDREPRGAIEVTYDAGTTRITALATHLGLAAAERKRQVEKLTASMHRHTKDLRILMADFNEWRPGNRLHRQLSEHYSPSKALRTFPSGAPLLALDRIYVAPHGRIERVHVDRSGVARIASDHLPLVADIRL